MLLSLYRVWLSSRVPSRTILIYKEKNMITAIIFNLLNLIGLYGDAAVVAILKLFGIM
jgi:hypothetical protein